MGFATGLEQNRQKEKQHEEYLEKQKEHWACQGAGECDACLAQSDGEDAASG